MRNLLRRVGLVSIGAVAMALIGLAIGNAVPDGHGLIQRLAPVPAVDSAQFQRDAMVLLDSDVTQGNTITDLQNGDAFFPAMLADIRAARHSVDLESYIFRQGKIARAFVAALSERAQAGVKVHVLIDWVGSRANHADVDRLRAAGVQVALFHPLNLANLTRINKRTHRKLLITDGRVAYTGGMGIDDAWLGNARNRQQKRDMMFRIEGPAVWQMQAVFEEHWIATRGQGLIGAPYAPSPAPQAPGAIAIQTFSGSDSGGEHKTRQMFLMAIEGARKSIDVEASYFVPDALSRQVLLAALRRGVRVRIIVEGNYVDSHEVIDASHTYWGQLIRAGARIYRFGPSLFHSKLMVVDHYLTIGGSGNFDNRSFQLNAEANINVYDRAFGRHMTEVFDADVRASSLVPANEWQRQPWTQRLVDRFWATLAPQL